MSTMRMTNQFFPLLDLIIFSLRFIGLIFMIWFPSIVSLTAWSYIASLISSLETSLCVFPWLLKAVTLDLMIKYLFSFLTRSHRDLQDYYLPLWKLPCVCSLDCCKLWYLIWLIEYLLSFLTKSHPELLDYCSPFGIWSFVSFLHHMNS